MISKVIILTNRSFTMRLGRDGAYGRFSKPQHELRKPTTQLNILISKSRVCIKIMNCILSSISVDFVATAYKSVLISTERILLLSIPVL